jgi:uncharacterized protein with ParB-like and HNH nuclease domain
MQANKRTLNDIFAPTIRLIAPLFQRPYVWNRDDNWIPLWESIRDLAERRLHNTPIRPHFLGAVVLHQLLNAIGDIGGREIIDGQQRLTTLQVIFTALRDLCAQLEADDYRDALNSLVKNNTPGASNPDHLYKIWPTNSDRDQFKAVMNARSPFKVYHACRPNGTATAKVVGFGRDDDPAVQAYLLRHSGLSHEDRSIAQNALTKEQRKQVYLHIDGLHKINQSLPQAYFFFYAVLTDWLVQPDGQDFQERLQSLYLTLTQDLLLIAIDLDSNDDPQQIFETMNALGAPLLPADLVKNYLFRIATQQNLDTRHLYAEYWQIFDEKQRYWRKKIRQGRVLRPRVDLFLQHYLTLVTGEEVPVTDLFNVYKDWTRQDSRQANKLVAEFRHYADIFARFDSFDSDSREGLFFTRMNRLDTSTVFPLMLAVFHHHEETGADEKIREIMVDIESYLVRRAICGLTPKNYNRLFRSLTQQMHQTQDYSPEQIRQFLLKQTADTAIWPNDTDFKRAWMERPLYRALVQQRTRMILRALDRQLQSALTNTYSVVGTASIEHLMPQKWEEHWPLPDGVDREEAAQRRNNLIHTIGNLTIVTKSLNPSLSNSSWNKKLPAINQNSGLRINLDLPPIWDETAIKDRSAKFFELAVTIWPYPA